MAVKAYVRDEVEKKFRRLAMAVYGYGRGSLSKAAEEAFERWTAEHEALLREIDVPEDPVEAIAGMLKGLKKTGVELQHEARSLRARKGRRE